MVDEIGRGAFGVVYKCRLKDRKRLYACKVVPVGHLTSSQQHAVIREVLLLRKLKHPNIISFYTSFVEGKNLYILTEYAQGGDLQVSLTVPAATAARCCFCCYCWMLCLAVWWIDVVCQTAVAVTSLVLFGGSSHSPPDDGMPV